MAITDKHIHAQTHAYTHAYNTFQKFLGCSCIIRKIKEVLLKLGQKRNAWFSF